MAVPKGVAAADLKPWLTAITRGGKAMTRYLGHYLHGKRVVTHYAIGDRVSSTACRATADDQRPETVRQNPPLPAAIGRACHSLSKMFPVALVPGLYKSDWESGESKGGESVIKAAEKLRQIQPRAAAI